MNTEKKSEIFSVVQSFQPSKDGKSVYWILLEPKGFKGYDTFIDAYNGEKPTYRAKYFPRITKLDLSNNTISDFKILGNEKYYVRLGLKPLTDEKENSVTYIGNDDDYKKLWLAKFIFE